MLKIVLYIILLPLSIYSLQSLNIEKILKLDKQLQARTLILLLSISLTYLSANFIYDFLINTRIM